MAFLDFIIQKTNSDKATVMPATYPTRGAREKPIGATSMKHTHMKVRKAAGMEHIQCDFPLLTRYAAPVHITRAAKV